MKTNSSECSADSSTTDGGPAFPLPSYEAGNPWDWQGQGGMSLRDWFAGQALTGMLSDPRWEMSHTSKKIAVQAYNYADAMIAQRGAS